MKRKLKEELSLYGISLQNLEEEEQGFLTLPKALAEVLGDKEEDEWDKYA